MVRPQYVVSQSSWTNRDANNELGEEEKNRANVTLQVTGKQDLLILKTKTQDLVGNQNIKFYFIFAALL